MLARQECSFVRTARRWPLVTRVGGVVPVHMGVFGSTAPIAVAWGCVLTDDAGRVACNVAGRNYAGTAGSVIIAASAADAPFVITVSDALGACPAGETVTTPRRTVSTGGNRGTAVLAGESLRVCTAN